MTTTETRPLTLLETARCDLASAVAAYDHALETCGDMGAAFLRRESAERAVVLAAETRE
jgi:hypothetical protein